MHRKTCGLTRYEFESPAFDGLVHSVFTRLGGVSRGPYATLNVGASVGDEASAVIENHARIYAQLQLDADKVLSPVQVHGNRVAVVGRSTTGKRFAGTDGLLTAETDVALLLRFADCQPILLYDPVRRAAGLIHAGWRGVAQAIARRAVETMHTEFGSRPRDLVAGLGPAIGPCCYVVGQEVAAAMGYALPDWQKVMAPEGEAWRLDLTGANDQLLRSAGVRQIEHSQICTACRNDEFFSHRADHGLTGRFAVVVHLATDNNVQTASAHRTPVEANRSGATQDISSLNPPGFPKMSRLHGVEG